MTNTQSPAPGVAADDKLFSDCYKAMARAMYLLDADKGHGPVLSKLADCRVAIERRTALQASAAAVPVAWRRQEAGIWVYYETKAWDDLEPLYTAPPLPAQVQAAEAPERNNPVSALSIRLLVAAGHVTQEKADEAFRLACQALEAEAVKMNVELPWVARTPAPGMAGDTVFKGPNKWTDEEVANGHKGIRWINIEGIQGQPTSHDVMDYLTQRGEAAYCSCDKCKAFFSAPHPSPAPQAAGAAFDDGWRLCAKWAKRDDLLADMDSPAFSDAKVICLAAIEAGRAGS